MGRLLLHASRRRYSNPRLSKLFRNAPPNATFPQTDHSLDGMQRRMRALASLTNKLKACGHIDDVLGLFQADRCAVASGRADDARADAFVCADFEAVSKAKEDA